MKSEGEQPKPSTPPSSAKPEFAMTEEQWDRVFGQVRLHLAAEKAHALRLPELTKGLKLTPAELEAVYREAKRWLDLEPEPPIPATPGEVKLSQMD